MGEYIPQAPINDKAKKHNKNLPGMGGIFNTVNMHTYHYAGNNPIKLTDPDGKKEKPSIKGIQGILPLVDEIDTGSWAADAFLKGCGDIWNSVASLFNGTANYFFVELPNAVDTLITVIDDLISDTLSLTGSGLKEDMYVGGIFAGMNPEMVAEAVTSLKIMVAGLSATNASVATVSSQLTTSQARAIRSYEKRIVEHINKLNDFIKNPTIKSGMEHLPKEVIKQQQYRRINALIDEIQNYNNSIDKILN
jgi:hypothetical protein